MELVRNIVMDLIRIENLKTEAIIGIFPWEREVRQLISVDLEIRLDSKAAGKSDKIKDALDYKEVSKRILLLINETKSKLIEHLAEKIASLVLTEFPVESIKVYVKKPGALRGSSVVGIEIERTRS